MAETGEELVEAIQRDLACPQCEYNLRGLYGAVVSCPECGAECDIAKLVSLRWTKPWHQAPGLNIVFLPTAWSVGGLLGVPLALRVGLMEGTACSLIWLTVWVWLLWRAWGLFQSAEGVYLALASHALFAGYVLGIGGFVIAMSEVVEYPDLATQIAIAACAVVVTTLLLWSCRWFHRFIAKRCIRRYLARSGRI